MMNRTITLDWLQSKDACDDDLKWFADKYADNSVSLKKLISDLQDAKKYDCLNWLLITIFTNREKAKYAIFTANLTIPVLGKLGAYKKELRTAVEAAKVWIDHPTEEKRLDAHDASSRAVCSALYAVSSAVACLVYATLDPNHNADYDASYAAYDSARAANAAFGKNDETYKKITDYGIELLMEAIEFIDNRPLKNGYDFIGIDSKLWNQKSEIEEALKSKGHHKTKIRKLCVYYNLVDDTPEEENNETRI